jgi:hypothetical protein
MRFERDVTRFRMMLLMLLMLRDDLLAWPLSRVIDES